MKSRILDPGTVTILRRLVPGIFNLFIYLQNNFPDIFIVLRMFMCLLDLIKRENMINNRMNRLVGKELKSNGCKFSCESGFVLITSWGEQCSSQLNPF